MHMNKIPLLPRRGARHLMRFTFCLLLLAQSVAAQIQIDASPADAKRNRDRGLDMLSKIKQLVEKEYYDKTFHGIDLDERFKVAAGRVRKLNANSHIFRVIAQVLLDFNDSHTRFIPPPRAMKVEYGLAFQMIGNECFVVDVDKSSDAGAKGVRAGDVVLKINGYTPNRQNLSTIMYLIYQLDPQERLTLALRGPDGAEREVVCGAKFKTMEEISKEVSRRRSEKKEMPFKCKELAAAAVACKLYTFSVEKDRVDKMMKEVAGYQRLILDLRGNSGGYVKTLQHLLGYFFNHDVKMGTEARRDGIRDQIAKSHKEKAYGGELLVLIDGNSASASEVFARVIQIEGRGKVVGDVSAGAVMKSRFYSLASGTVDWSFGRWSVYGVSVTISDLMMRDGSRLEGAGVIPDRPVGPSASALREKDDPVLAYAAALFGVKLSPEQARQFHFIKNRYENYEDDEDEDVDN